MSTFSLTDPKSIAAELVPSPAAVPIWAGEQRILFPGVDWHTYDQLSQARGEGNHVLLIYDGKDLEIMVVGNIHDLLKEPLTAIVRAVAVGRNMDFMASGQATWKSETRGLEADLSYYFDAEKLRQAREGLMRRSMNSADFPYPDLAIEIDLSPSKVDRPSIYGEAKWRSSRTIIAPSKTLPLRPSFRDRDGEPVRDRAPFRGRGSG